MQELIYERINRFAFASCVKRRQADKRAQLGEEEAEGAEKVEKEDGDGDEPCASMTSRLASMHRQEHMSSEHLRATPWRGCRQGGYFRR